MKTDLRMTRLGARAHFAIPALLQKTAAHYGLHIQREAGNVYRVFSTAESFDIGAFCPDDIHRDGDRFTLNDLILFLDFLHQPLRNVIEKTAKGDQGKNERVSLHRFLRYMASGSVEIPEDVNDELQKETAECHAKTEQAMRDDDAWASHFELGSAVPSQSALPGSFYDPACGFVLSVRPPCTEAKSQQGRAQSALHGLFRDMIQNACKGKHQESPHRVLLTGTELSRFCKLFQEHARKDEEENILFLLERAEFEEAVQKRLEAVEARAQKIALSKGVAAIYAQTPEKDPAAKLKALIRCSSALSPILNKKEMREIWTRYHFTDRNDSPLPGIAKEYACMIAVMELYARQKTLDYAQVEAITHEFMPLISFSQKMTDRFQNAAQKKYGLEIQKLAHFKNVFKNASVLAPEVQTDFLADPYKDVLQMLEKFYGAGKSLPSEMVSAGVETTVDFSMDVVNFIRESPKIAAAFVILSGSLYLMKNANNSDAGATQDTVMVFGEQGLEQAAADMDSLPAEARVVQNWHYDMGVFGLYKHYMYDNAVVGPAQTILDWARMGIHWTYGEMGVPINAEPAFSKTTASVAEPIANKLFALNIFQNASHVAFWMYMVSKGFKHKLRGGRKILDLLSPLTDLGYGMGVREAELLRLKKRTSLSHALMALGSPHADTPPLSYEGKACLIREIVSAAEARIALENDFPDRFKTADITMKQGLKGKFHISAGNCRAAMEALEKFDAIMEHISGQIGVSESWYRDYLSQKARSVTQALKAYAKSGDTAALQIRLQQDLHELTGAEIRLSGQSTIFEALTGHRLDSKQASKLRSDANAQYADMRRAHKIQRQKGKLKEAPSFGDKFKAQGMIIGTAVWGGIVAATRTISKLGESFAHKWVMIPAAGLAAACVALDMAGHGNNFTNAVSSGTGAGVSAATITTAFLLYNFWEDVLGVHVGSGIMLLLSGTAAGYAYERIIRPGVHLTLEKLGLRAGVASDNSAATALGHDDPRTHPIERKSFTAAPPRLVPVTLTIHSRRIEDHCLQCPSAQP